MGDEKGRELDLDPTLDTVEIDGEFDALPQGEPEGKDVEIINFIRAVDEIKETLAQLIIRERDVKRNLEGIQPLIDKFENPLVYRSYIEDQEKKNQNVNRNIHMSMALLDSIIFPKIREYGDPTDSMALIEIEDLIKNGRDKFKEQLKAGDKEIRSLDDTTVDQLIEHLHSVIFSNTQNEKTSNLNIIPSLFNKIRDEIKQKKTILRAFERVRERVFHDIEEKQKKDEDFIDQRIKNIITQMKSDKEAGDTIQKRIKDRLEHVIKFINIYKECRSLIEKIERENQNLHIKPLAEIADNVEGLKGSIDKIQQEQKSKIERLLSIQQFYAMYHEGIILLKHLHAEDNKNQKEIKIIEAIEAIEKELKESQDDKGIKKKSKQLKELKNKRNVEEIKKQLKGVEGMETMEGMEAIERQLKELRDRKDNNGSLDYDLQLQFELQHLKELRYAVLKLIEPLYPQRTDTLEELEQMLEEVKDLFEKESK